MVTQTTTHQADALARLPERHKGKTRLAALINACTKETQNLENALYQIATERALAIAVGAQLDVIGRVLNQDRAVTSDDDEYRDLLRVRILVNRSSGSNPDLYDIAKALLPGANVFVRNTPPASFALDLSGIEVDDVTAALLASLISEAKAAGIGGQVVSQPQENNLTFLTALTTLTTATFNPVTQTQVFVASTKGFPDSGFLIFGLASGDELAVSYGRKTATSFYELTNLNGDTVVKAVGELVYATRVCSKVALSTTSATTSIVITDASRFPSSGHVMVGSQNGDRFLLFSYSGKSGNTLTGLVDTGIGVAASTDPNSLVSLCGNAFSDDSFTTSLGGALSRADQA